MLKSILDFLATGVLLIVGYLIYFVSVAILTVILGIPIAFGIHITTQFINLLFNGV